MKNQDASGVSLRGVSLRTHHRVFGLALLLCVLLGLSKPAAAQALTAQSMPQDTDDAGSSEAARGKWKRRWIASWIALAAVNALDVSSSVGHAEANPLYRNSSGRFDVGKAILIKSAIGGAIFTTQWLASRSQTRKNLYKPFTIVNTVGAGALAGVAAHNYSLPPSVSSRTLAALTPQN